MVCIHRSSSLGESGKAVRLHCHRRLVLAAGIPQDDHDIQVPRSLGNHKDRCEREERGCGTVAWTRDRWTPVRLLFS